MKQNLFFKCVFITIVLIYMVILAGSVVRMTGSGMGCPDWPKCFGQWIPPTEISQLPTNYEEIFLEKRVKKIEKYTSFLSKLGFGEIADKLNSDSSLKEQEPFVAIKTWIEYINRLVGFMAGNFLIVMTFLSLFLWKKDKRLFILSFATLLFTGFQGWFGSLVVVSNLTPWTITVHMFFALLIIYALVRLYSLRYESKMSIASNERLILIGALLICLVQIYFGTQVRQEIDIVSKSGITRDGWIESLSSIFELHRTFAILVLILNGYLIFKLKDRFRTICYLIGFCLMFEVFTGIVMSYFAVPKVAQPIHLLLSTLLFGLYVYVLSRSGSDKTI